MLVREWKGRLERVMILGDRGIELMAITAWHPSKRHRRGARQTIRFSRQIVVYAIARAASHAILALA